MSRVYTSAELESLITLLPFKYALSTTCHVSIRVGPEYVNGAQSQATLHIWDHLPRCSQSLESTSSGARSLACTKRIKVIFGNWREKFLAVLVGGLHLLLQKKHRSADQISTSSPPWPWPPSLTVLDGPHLQKTPPFRLLYRCYAASSGPRDRGALLEVVRVMEAPGPCPRPLLPRRPRHPCLPLPGEFLFFFSFFVLVGNVEGSDGEVELLLLLLIYSMI